jgi:hypothetical protein
MQKLPANIVLFKKDLRDGYKDWDFGKIAIESDTRP